MVDFPSLAGSFQLTVMRSLVTLVISGASQGPGTAESYTILKVFVERLQINVELKSEIKNRFSESKNLVRYNNCIGYNM